MKQFLLQFRSSVVGLLALIIFALILSLQSTLSFATEIKDIRMWHAPDRSRIVFDIDEAVDYKIETLASPERLFIDLKNTKIVANIPQPGTTGQFIEKIRTGQPVPGVSRVVFDLAKPVRYEIQMIPPVNNYKYRLVIDYYPADSKAEVVKHSAAPKTRPKTVDSVTTTPKQATVVPPERRGDIIVVVDAGHGGEDPGALGKRSREKDVVLQISKKLVAKLNATPGVKGVLTRSGDYYIPLRRRIRIARAKEADLFVSIHANAFKNSRPRGASVFALSQRGATSERAKILEQKENASDLVGGISIDDKDDLLADVLLDLSLTKTINESVVFGKEVLTQLSKVGKVHSKRVEQAGFVVLKSPDIPSILVETAFISNPSDEKLLTSSKQQDKFAGAILKGIQSYLKKRKNYYANN